MAEFDRSSSAGHLLNLAARRASRLVGRRLERLGIAPAQLSVLLELAATPSATQRELADALGVEQPTMARTVSRMQRDGLVDVIDDAADRRRRPVTLTSAARALVADAERAADAANEELLAPLDAGERTRLVLLLRSMLAPDGDTDPAEGSSD